jgi:hypothetical protein
VTRAATRIESAPGRIFPNTGLSAGQISDALRWVDLDPQFYNLYCDTEHYGLDFFKELLYAYTKSGIPLILGVDLYEKDFSTRNSVCANNTTLCWHYADSHAVTITGYGLSSNPCVSTPSTGNLLQLSAHRIKEIYVHDDQVGPFSKMGFYDTLEDSRIEINAGNCISEITTISTSWKNDMRAMPICLLVPLYHKIRIGYKKIRRIVFDINEAFHKVANCSSSSIDTYMPQWESTFAWDITWDIALSCINTVKEEFFQDNTITSEERRRFLEISSPRFVWRCIIERHNQPLLELMFDATSSESDDDLFVHRIEYDVIFSYNFKFLANLIYSDPGASQPLAQTLWRITQ